MPSELDPSPRPESLIWRNTRLARPSQQREVGSPGRGRRRARPTKAGPALLRNLEDKASILECLAAPSLSSPREGGAAPAERNIERESRNNCSQRPAASAAPVKDTRMRGQGRAAACEKHATENSSRQLQPPSFFRLPPGPALQLRDTRVSLISAVCNEIPVGSAACAGEEKIVGRHSIKLAFLPFFLSPPPRGCWRLALFVFADGESRGIIMHLEGSSTEISDSFPAHRVSDN